MLEAMAGGVVPICLDMRSGIRDAVEHGVNGLIVKDRAGDFFEAVKKLQTNRVMWQRLSLAAQKTVSQRYSVEACGRQWADLLRTLEKESTRRKAFKIPRLLRLPPPNSKFGYHDMRGSWRRKLRNYVRSFPTLHRLAKTALVGGRSNKHGETGT